MSGIALRHMRVDREFRHALDKARDQATQFGIVDEREEVVSHWEEAKSWVVPPVAVGGDLLGGGAGFQLLVGYTRLGNLLGMLDREEVPEAKKHFVWIGRELRKRPMTRSSILFRPWAALASTLCWSASAVGQEFE